MNVCPHLFVTLDAQDKRRPKTPSWVILIERFAISKLLLRYCSGQNTPSPRRAQVSCLALVRGVTDNVACMTATYITLSTVFLHQKLTMLAACCAVSCIRCPSAACLCTRELLCHWSRFRSEGCEIVCHRELLLRPKLSSRCVCARPRRPICPPMTGCSSDEVFVFMYRLSIMQEVIERNKKMQLDKKIAYDNKVAEVRRQVLHSPIFLQFFYFRSKDINTIHDT